MKIFKQSKKFAALTLLMAPMVLGSLQQAQQVYAAEAGTEQREVRPITLTLHKVQMDELPELIENTGSEMPEFSGYDKLDGVNFEIYNITNAYYQWQSKDKNNNGELFKVKVQDGTAKIEEGKLIIDGTSYDLATPVTTEYTVDGKVSTPIPTATAGKDSAFIVVEKDAPSIVTGKAAPIFFALPLDIEGDELSEIHLYPKNVVKTGGLYAEKVIQTLDGNKALDGVEFVVHNQVEKEGMKYLGTLNNQGVREWVDTLEDAEKFETKEGGKLNIPNLALGDYFLSEITTKIGENQLGLLHDEVINRPFTIDGVVDDHGHDVHFEDALINDDLVVDKDNESKLYEYGEAIQYTVKTTVPSGINQQYIENGQNVYAYQTFTLQDNHDEKLKLREDSIKFFDGEQEVTMVKDTDYKIINQTDDSFTISFIMGGRINSLGNKVLTVKYDMEITATADPDTEFVNEVLGNTTFVDHYGNPGGDGDDDEGEEVKTGGRQFIKIDVDNAKELAGAKFYIRNSDGQALYRDTANENRNEWKDYVENGENLVTLTSDQYGKFAIAGLNAGDYELVEIESPTGYILPSGGFDFTVVEGSFHRRETLDIENKSKGTLPATGGIGTVIFYLVGGLTMVGAYVATRRKKS